MLWWTGPFQTCRRTCSSAEQFGRSRRRHIMGTSERPASNSLGPRSETKKARTTRYQRHTQRK
jgi:hypothetical protein